MYVYLSINLYTYIYLYMGVCMYVSGAHMHMCAGLALFLDRVRSDFNVRNVCKSDVISYLRFPRHYC